MKPFANFIKNKTAGPYRIIDWTASDPEYAITSHHGRKPQERLKRWILQDIEMHNPNLYNKIFKHYPEILI